MKSLVAIDSKPCRNESIFRDVFAMNQIPPNPQELQLSPKLLILINSYSWFKRQWCQVRLTMEMEATEKVEMKTVVKHRIRQHKKRC